MQTLQTSIPFLKMGVELEVEVLDDPDKYSTHVSAYTIYGSYPKHESLGREHGKHGKLIARADKLTSQIKTHYDNTVNDGWEWIGEPLSLDENLTEWGKLLTDDYLKKYIHGDDVKVTPGHGYGIHDCGMHVHVSGDIVNKETLGRLLVFFNRPKNKELLEYVAGRSLNKFCHQTSNMKVELTEFLYHSPNCSQRSKRGRKFYHKYDGSYDTHSVETGLWCCDNAHVFLQMLHTHAWQRGAIWVLPMGGTGDFEIRIFKSTVDIDKFTVNLQFVTAVTEFASQTSNAALAFEDFGDWLSSYDNKLKYSLLFKFLRKKGYTEGIIPSKLGLAA